MVNVFKAPGGQCNLRHFSLFYYSKKFLVFPLLFILIVTLNGQNVTAASSGATTISLPSTESPATLSPFIELPVTSHQKSNFVSPPRILDYNFLNVSGKIGTSLGLSTFQAKCQEKQFQCGNNDCINVRLVCDGEPDCEDASDELVEGCHRFGKFRF